MIEYLILGSLAGCGLQFSMDTLVLPVPFEEDLGWDPSIRVRNAGCSLE